MTRDSNFAANGTNESPFAWRRKLTRRLRSDLAWHYDRPTGPTVGCRWGKPWGKPSENCRKTIVSMDFMWKTIGKPSENGDFVPWGDDDVWIGGKRVGGFPE